jgi:hypothetical protein
MSLLAIVARTSEVWYFASAVGHFSSFDASRAFFFRSLFRATDPFSPIARLLFRDGIAVAE